MKKMLLALGFILVFSNLLLGMISVDEDYVTYPENFIHLPLLYSNHDGFMVDYEGQLYPIDNKYVSEELHGIDCGELLIKLGKLWQVTYRGRSFLVNRMSPYRGINSILLEMEQLPEEIRRSIEDSTPPTRKLEIYFPAKDKIGIRLTK